MRPDGRMSSCSERRCAALPLCMEGKSSWEERLEAMSLVSSQSSSSTTPSASGMLVSLSLAPSESSFSFSSSSSSEYVDRKS